MDPAYYYKGGLLRSPAGLNWTDPTGQTKRRTYADAKVGTGPANVSLRSAGMGVCGVGTDRKRGWVCRGFRMKRQRNMPTRANRIRIVGGC